MSTEQPPTQTVDREKRKKPEEEESDPEKTESESDQDQDETESDQDEEKESYQNKGESDQDQDETESYQNKGETESTVKPFMRIEDIMPIVTEQKIPMRYKKNDNIIVSVKNLDGFETIVFTQFIKNSKRHKHHPVINIIVPNELLPTTINDIRELTLTFKLYLPMIIHSLAIIQKTVPRNGYDSDVLPFRNDHRTPIITCMIIGIQSDKYTEYTCVHKVKIKLFNNGCRAKKPRVSNVVRPKPIPFADIEKPLSL
jgi:hypothetical protein